MHIYCNWSIQSILKPGGLSIICVTVTKNSSCRLTINRMVAGEITTIIFAYITGISTGMRHRRVVCTSNDIIVVTTLYLAFAFNSSMVKKIQT